MKTIPTLITLLGCVLLVACGGGSKSAKASTSTAQAVPYANISWTRYPIAPNRWSSSVAAPLPLVPVPVANQPYGAFDGYVYDSESPAGLVGFTAVIPVNSGTQPDAAVTALLSTLQTSLTGSTLSDIDPVTLADSNAAGTLQSIQLPANKPLRTLLNEVLQSIAKTSNSGSISNLISPQTGEPSSQNYQLSLGLVHRTTADEWVLTVAIVETSQYTAYADPMFVFTSTSNVDP